MIKYLTHQQIDKSKWNACVEHSLNSMMYAYSWYLDVAAPNWDALVLDDYEAVFPMVHGNKFSLSYLYQPLFTQQLGLFFTNLANAEKLTEFIQAIPVTYRYIDINLNYANLLPNEGASIALVKRKNYILDLDKPYTKTFKNYTEHSRRNTNKSKKSNLNISICKVNEVVEMYILQRGMATLNVTQKDYKRFEKITEAIADHKILIPLAVKNENNHTLASAVFAISNNRIFYLMGTSNDEGKEKRAMYFLFDHIIEKYSNQQMILDFEGSEIQGVAHFFKGFGATKQHYFKLRINNLPWYIKWLKK